MLVYQRVSESSDSGSNHVLTFPNHSWTSWDAAQRLRQLVLPEINEPCIQQKI